MARINIVLATTSKGPSEQECVGGYIVEEIINGKAKKCEKFLYREHISRDELTLQLLANAITLVKRSENEYESIEIYSDAGTVKNAFINHWIDNWNENDWITAKKEKVKHEDTWKFIWKTMQPIMERCIFCSKESRWSNELHQHCENELEKVKNTQLVEENVKKIKEMLDHGNDKR